MSRLTSGANNGRAAPGNANAQAVAATASPASAAAGKKGDRTGRGQEDGEDGEGADVTAPRSAFALNDDDGGGGGGGGCGGRVEVLFLLAVRFGAVGMAWACVCGPLSVFVSVPCLRNRRS